MFGVWDAVFLRNKLNKNKLTASAETSELKKHTMLINQYLIRIWATSWQNQQNGMCTQRRLRSAWASAQSDQSLRSLSAWTKLGSLATHWAHSEDSDQTGRVFLVFAGRTYHFVGFVMGRLISICEDTRTATAEQLNRTANIDNGIREVPINFLVSSDLVTSGQAFRDLKFSNGCNVILYTIPGQNVTILTADKTEE